MTLVERLRERWERIDGAAATKIDRILKERREAADRIEALEAALRDLSSEVFGDGPSSEPDVYADYDRLNDLHRKTSAALAE